jgi:flagellar biosynthetic protein FlhB
VVEDIQLARALAGQVRVGRAIPVEFYAPVAEVLAFVYRLRRKIRGLPAA